jgi:hypothetical protein
MPKHRVLSPVSIVLARLSDLIGAVAASLLLTRSWSPAPPWIQETALVFRRIMILLYVKVRPASLKATLQTAQPRDTWP